MKRSILSLIILCSALTAAAQATLNVGYVKDGDNLSSIPYDGYSGVCSSVSADIIRKYAGSEVIGLRIAVGSTTVTNVRAFLSADPDPAQPQNDLAYATPASVTSEWNEITFEQPYTLKGTETELYVGYYFTCESTEERPVLVGTTKNNYGLLVYELGSYGKGWYDYSATGDLAVQLILRGDNLPDYDVALEDLFTDSRYYATTAQTMQMAVTLVNTGTKPIPGLTLNLSFDGNAQLGGNIQVGEEISGTMTLPLELSLNEFGLTAGRHTLTLRATEAIGGAQLNSEDSNSHTATYTFYIYNEAMTRNGSLIEVFATTDDYYDSRFMQPLAEFLSSRTDVIPVCIYGLDQENDSQMAVTGASDLATAAGVSTLPSFGVNRTCAPGNTDYLYGYVAQTEAGDFAELVDYMNAVTPSFATVSLSGSYDVATRLLTLKATGLRNTDFRTFFNYGAMTIYLTEDGVDGHDHVLRRIITSSLGNVINWNDNGGNGFSKDFRVTLDPAWDASKMHAIAFITKLTAATTRHDNMEVTNAVSLPLATLMPNGISNFNAAADTAPQATYDLSGRKLQFSASHPGIRIHQGRKVAIR